MLRPRMDENRRYDWKGLPRGSEMICDHNLFLTKWVPLLVKNDPFREIHLFFRKTKKFVSIFEHIFFFIGIAKDNVNVSQSKRLTFKKSHWFIQLCLWFGVHFLKTAWQVVCHRKLTKYNAIKSTSKKRREIESVTHSFYCRNIFFFTSVWMWFLGTEEKGTKKGSII